LLACGCQMRAVVAEIENAPVNSNQQERDNHDSSTSTPAL
jgi:hypothetical protein